MVNQFVADLKDSVREAKSKAPGTGHMVTVYGMCTLGLVPPVTGPMNRTPPVSYRFRPLERGWPGVRIASGDNVPRYVVRCVMDLTPLLEDSCRRRYAQKDMVLTHVY